VHVYGEAKTLNHNEFTYTGFVFAGWAKSADGDVEFTDGQSVINLTETDGDTVTLYARWGAFSYKVSYAGNGGAGEMPDSNFTYGVSQHLPGNEFTRTGYLFAGWARTAGGDAEFTDGQSVINLTEIAGDTVTLHAVWVPITYTVVYDKNAEDAAGTTANSEHTYDEDENLNANGFTRAEYIFSGWARTTGGDVEFTDEQSVINLTETNEAIITLHAVWNSKVIIIKNFAPNDLPEVWSLPDEVRYPAIIEVYSVGGGGGGQGGAASFHTSDPSRSTGASGGGGAATYMSFETEKSVQFDIVVGHGGTGGNRNAVAVGTWEPGWNGGDGGQSKVTWDGISLTAEGGSGGNRGNSWELIAGQGGAAMSQPLAFTGGFDSRQGGNGVDGDRWSRSASQGGSAGRLNIGSINPFGGGDSPYNYNIDERPYNVMHTNGNGDAGNGHAATPGAGGSGGLGFTGGNVITGWAAAYNGIGGGNGQVMIVVTYW